MLQIKKAGIEDIGLIHDLAHAIWPDAYKEILSQEQLSYMLELIYSRKALSNQIENLHHNFIIIKDDDTPVGFASYSPKIKDDNATWRLHKLYVLTNQQGKGTGKFLLNYIIGEVKQAGAKTLELNVNKYNKALQFYKRIGFTISREEDIDIGNGYFMNDYIMNYEC